MKVTCVRDAKTILGEGPFWDVADQRLYCVDTVVLSGTKLCFDAVVVTSRWQSASDEDWARSVMPLPRHHDLRARGGRSGIIQRCRPL